MTSRKARFDQQGLDARLAATRVLVASDAQASADSNATTLTVATGAAAAAAAAIPAPPGGTTGDYLRGDVSWQPLNKAAVGLGSVDNSADAAKAVLSATRLATARTLAATGDVTWTGSFDGSANFSVTATIAANAVTFAKLVAATAAGIVGATAAGNFAQLTAAQAKTILAIAAGDVSGLAAIATSGSATDLASGTVAAARMPAFSGDVATSAGGVTTTLATVNATTGSFGSATQSLTVTFDGKGRATSVAAQTVTPAVGSITGLAAGVAAFLGTPSSANLAAAITDETGSGPLVFGTSPTLATPVINGLATGTGVAATSTASTLAARDVNKNLLSNNFLADYTTTATAAGTTTLTVGSTYLQFFTGTTTQTVTLPVASTLALGQQYQIVNNSTGVVTVNASGGGAVIVLAGGTSATLTCILITGTTAASWSAGYWADAVASGKKLTVSNSLTLAGSDGLTLTVGAAASVSGSNTGDQTSVSGNAGTATALATGRTIGMTGDVVWTSPTFDGSGNVTAAGTIQAGAVTLAKMANLAANSIIGNNTGSAATPIALTAGQVKTFLAIANTDVSGLGTASTANTGTSGHVLAFADGANTWAGVQTYSAQQNINAGVLQTGGTCFRIENTFGSAATGGAGAGIEFGMLSGGSFIQNLNRTSSAYITFRCDALSYTFNINGTTGGLTISSGGAVAIPGTLSVTGNTLVTGTGGLGYGTGSGGTVTQATSKATGVTLNKTNGQITMNGAALAASTSVSFTLTNSTIAATDVVNVSIASGATSLAYILVVEATAAGSCKIAIRNVSGGTLSEAIVLNFAVLKAVNA